MAGYRLLSAAKLNLSLRVTGKRGDGYHNIVSLFWRLPSAETLLVSAPWGARSDSVRSPGMEIEGENIVSRALRLARDAGADVPFLDVEITKTLCPGSGIGAGSGNGAAILRWLAGGKGLDDRLKEGKEGGTWRDVALKTGADVPFLFSGFPLACVSGIGESVAPLPLENPLEIFPLLVFPEWSVGTENAYAQLDHRCNGDYPLNDAEARAEADGLLRRLSGKEKAGFLPNDFAPGLMKKFPGYGELFRLFEKSAARAWGITGSGGAAFALYRRPVELLSSEWPSWVRQVLPIENL